MVEAAPKEKLIEVQTQESFIKDLIVRIPKESDTIVFAPKIGTTPEDDESNSLVTQLFNTIIEANKRGVDAKIITDLHYSQYTRVGIRTLANWWPLDKEKRKIKKLNKISTRTNLETLKNAGVLQDLQPRIQSNRHSTLIRNLTSRHLLQRWAIAHQKGAIIDSSFTISTGNLTSSDIYDMNNFAIKFEGKYGEGLAGVVTELMAPNAKLRDAGAHDAEIDDIMIVHDYNNVGDPGRLPIIQQIAEKLIHPSRDGHIDLSNPNLILTPKKTERVVYLSPYIPDGKLLIALKEAQRQGVKVVIPRQPKGDYRETTFPFNIQAWSSHINGIKNVQRPYREKPSHIKCLITKYEDGSAAVLFGSDNLSTYIQKLMRNEEMAVLIRINKNSSEEIKTFYKDLYQTLFRLGEINEETYSSLDLSARDGT